MRKWNVALHFFAGIAAWWNFVQVAQQTGFSLKWQLACGLLAVFVLAWAGAHLILAERPRWLRLWKTWQPGVRVWGLILLALAFLGYIVFFQYTKWGVIFTGPWLRLFLWAVLTEIGALLLTRAAARWFDYATWLAVTLVSGTGFVLAKAFSRVSDYPFWLFWSEGNRIWDFSLLFGRHLYNYPAGQPIPSMIDFGRQLLWGAIFLLPHPTIAQVRFWSALMFTLPLLLFGWVLFRRTSHSRLWWLAGLWGFVFLYQGPIYSQLIVSAILVALAWRRPLWLAGPLVFAAAWFAQISRWTWMFAPAIWIVMLEFAGAERDADGRLPRQAWIRAAALGFSGLLGGYLLPALQEMWAAARQPLELLDVSARIGHQPLLWYRLLPNPTYPPGIILGLVIVILPPLAWLVAVCQRGWQLTGWQRLLLWGAMLAFGVVGLVASTKIGGGSNLHNLDMFLIGMVFLVALAWRAGGEDMVAQLHGQSAWVQVVLLALVLQPVWQAPLALRPLRYDRDSVLPFYTERPLPANLPEEAYIPQALDIIRDTIASAQGEILFMDQRQLLTFGYVPAIPLVPEYEKKMMMNEAMGDNAAWFAPYYRDLAVHRFALIISEPLIVHYQEPGRESFAEENNAWMRWVAEPTLCYYEPVSTMERVNVQLLIPRQEPVCSIDGIGADGPRLVDTLP